jgi:hypothetical protein
MFQDFETSKGIGTAIRKQEALIKIANNLKHIAFWRYSINIQVIVCLGVF